MQINLWLISIDITLIEYFPIIAAFTSRPQLPMNNQVTFKSWLNLHTNVQESILKQEVPVEGRHPQQHGKLYFWFSFPVQAEHGMKAARWEAGAGVDVK